MDPTFTLEWLDVDIILGLDDDDRQQNGFATESNMLLIVYF